MKKTISEDKKVRVLDEVILNDNSLLRYCMEDPEHSQYIYVSVRYIEMSAIRESSICKLDIESNLNPIINISSDRSVIAVFNQEGGIQVLQRIYDLNEHMFIPSDFMNSVYNEKFLNNDDCQIILKK